MKLTRKRLLEIAGIPVNEALTATQKKGLFVIGSDVAKERYEYDMDALLDDISGIMPGYREDVDFTFEIGRGDDFPNAIEILPKSLSKLLANKDAVEFLVDLEGDGSYEAKRPKRGLRDGERIIFKGRTVKDIRDIVGGSMTFMVELKKDVEANKKTKYGEYWLVDDEELANNPQGSDIRIYQFNGPEMRVKITDIASILG